MALIHRATLSPTKAELVAAWLPAQPWFDRAVTELKPIAAYRFDDPAGEVGIESHLFEVDGELVHVPLTYRGAPLPEAEPWLLGTMEHSVLGTRWAYDAVGDPVYRAEVSRVIREADSQARVMVETADGVVEREPWLLVRGSGDGAGSTVVVVRRPGTEQRATGALTGTWPGQDTPVTLVYLEA